MADTPIKFSDVQLDHPWVIKYRLPVVENFYPRWRYFISVAIPLEEENFYNLEMPTEEEAMLLASYLEYRIDYWEYSPQSLNKLRAETLDVDNVITVCIGHTIGKGWQYRYATEGSSLFPNQTSHTKFTTLMELLDYLEKGWDGERINKRWAQWIDKYDLI